MKYFILLLVAGRIIQKTWTMPSPLPEPGQIVSARQHLLRLSSWEDEGLGEELAIVWELEPGVSCLEKAKLPALKAFDSPLKFYAFLDAVA